MGRSRRTIASTAADNKNVDDAGAHLAGQDVLDDGLALEVVELVVEVLLLDLRRRAGGRAQYERMIMYVCERATVQQCSSQDAVTIELRSRAAGPAKLKAYRS